MEEKELISLDTPLNILEEKLLSETDEDNVKTIIDIFNINLQKKNIVRTAKLAELQDKISDQIEKRIDKNADAFNNKDLLDYFKTIQDTISKTDISNEIKVPVQINQQQINLSMPQDTLDADSRQKVLDAIRSILSKQESFNEGSADIIDVDYDESEDDNLEPGFKEEE